MKIEDGSELNLGDAPMAPPLNIKNYQESKLRDAQVKVHGCPNAWFW